jgi:hypothetical protein
VRGSVVRQLLAQDFITALNAAGVGTDFIEAPDYTHAQVGNAPGRDELVTMGLADFFTACAFQGESISVRAPD